MIVRLPFPLTLGFKSLLARDIAMPDLDVRWVSYVHRRNSRGSSSCQCTILVLLESIRAERRLQAHPWARQRYVLILESKR
jgi:hypothetical protein